MQSQNKLGQLNPFPIINGRQENHPGEGQAQRAGELARGAC